MYLGELVKNNLYQKRNSVRLMGMLGKITFIFAD